MAINYEFLHLLSSIKFAIRETKYSYLAEKI